MKLIPVLTEKSLNAAKGGQYTFQLDKKFTKAQIRKEIERLFSVHVVTIKTLTFKKLIKKNYRGRVQNLMPFKKAIVRLAAKESIDLFETKENKK